MKWLGAVLVFICSCLGGLVASGREKQRLAECEAFLSFFAYVQNRISFFSAPTKTIFRDFSNEVLEDIGFLPALREEDGDLFINRFGKAFAKIKEKSALSEAECEIVTEFGACIGKSNTQLQIKQLSYWSKEMEEETKKQRERYAKNGKLARTLGFSLGAMLALLLL